VKEISPIIIRHINQVITVGVSSLNIHLRSDQVAMDSHLDWHEILTTPSVHGSSCLVDRTWLGEPLGQDFSSPSATI